MKSRDAVQIEQLTKRFGDFTAVDRISFTVHEGEIFGFLGPNGAGKTTTIKMLTGLLPPTSGAGHVGGIDITMRGSQIKHHLGYMSQMFSLYGDLTVIENIELFGGLYGVGRQELSTKTEWVLDMADLVDRRRQLTRDLPLGWKQRLALGCAILHSPSILFLDEPTSGVDPVARRRFWDLIDGLSARGTTIFVSTHYMEEAEYCHRLALMNRGRLIALDTPAALRSELIDPILEFETDDAPGAVEALRIIAGVKEVSLFGRSVHVVVQDEREARTYVSEVLTQKGMTCGGLERVPPTLEDVFVSRVREQGGAVIG